MKVIAKSRAKEKKSGTEEEREREQMGEKIAISKSGKKSTLIHSISHTNTYAPL